MNTFYSLLDSPVGELLLTEDGEYLTRVHFSHSGSSHAIDPNWIRDDSAATLTEVSAQLVAYFAGELRQFALPIRAAGTEFQQRVWTELQRIPYGETISYGELARRIGNPEAARAVGLANGKNPIGIIVPCHRVIGADGALTGFGGGIANKRRLLEIERKFAASLVSHEQHVLAI